MNFQLKMAVILLGSFIGSGGMPSVATAEQPTDSDTLTLEQVKAAGALRSSYRKPIPQSKIHETPQADLTAFREEIEPVLKHTFYTCQG